MDRSNDAHRLSLVPPGLQVSRIVDYAFAGDLVPLPSANSNGLIVYELPMATARRIAAGGTAELHALALDHGRNQQRFQIWNETPLTSRGDASAEITRSDQNEVHFGDFMRGHWQPTASPELEQDAADFLQQPGNFYSFDRESRHLLILAPAVPRVVFVFSE